ncbi:CPBP family intramembrane glutamic endopeptidase [Duganella aceris]|nr:CPBP family intramembrane glutamic endopeptidase [Duganella aceris]
MMLITFVLLALAMCAVWFRFPLWAGLLVAAILAGFVAGVLHPPAVIALAVFGAVAYLAGTAADKRLRIAAGMLTALLALALAMHKLPGFSNPVVIAGAVLSPGAAPFTQYANFDKGAVGLILLALLCSRVGGWAELRGVLRKTWPVLLATVAAVMAFAMAAGFVRPDFKLPQVTLLFLAVNLFFTVVAEEAFFRGLLQARLASSLGGVRHGQWIAVVVSALLFGAAHLAGGALYAILACIAGLGYAYAYQRTQRIEAAIIVHIALNAVHFIAFTYPYTAR